MEKILSIIIPTYNMEKYLRKCLDSLIIDKELMSQFEVLIINDGSKDSSSEIAHEYENQYPNTFRVIDKENGNYGSCINRGLKEAVGKYVKVLDADDYFNTNALIDYIKFLKEQNCDLVLNDCIKINERGDTIGSFDNLGLKRYTTIVFKKFASKRIFPQMHCIAYKKEKIYILNYKQTEGISYTDQEWVTIPMKNIETVVYTGLPLYYYLIGREGQTMDAIVMTKSFKHKSEVVLSIINNTLKYNGDDVHKVYLESKMLNFLEYLYKEHILYSFYEEKEFRNFDQLILNNFPTIEYKMRKKIMGKVINYWRIKKTYPFYIQLYFKLRKRI